MTHRVGFLFNHDQAHQVAHSLPVALALARGLRDVEVVLASTHPRLTAEIRRICAAAGASPTIVELKLRSGLTRALDAAFSAAAPVRKLMIYGEHLDFFRSLDLLVVAEKTSLVLKTRYGLHGLRIVHTRHGAGDRAVGFDPASALFDRVLVSGAKVRDRLIAEAGLDPSRISVVGYPKFDLAGGQWATLFGDRRPVVLYNPHASPRLSSWFRLGRRVLDVFACSDRFNLIFAPHVMLFERPVTISVSPPGIALPGRIAARRRDASNIRVDLGGPACLDMTYTEAADIYLGDVSSQVYEFLRRPRPTVFLDAHRTAWRDDPDHLHWRTGPVVSEASAIERAIDEAVARHADLYAPIQRELFAYSFDLTDRPSSDRAAEVLAGMLAEPRTRA